jgi:F-type H+-transporting ATPase subunit alpha
LAQYRELAAFAQFGTSELDKGTRVQLERGERVTEILKQPQYTPLPMERQVIILYAVVNGYLDDVAVDELISFESDLYNFMEANHPGVCKEILEEKEITADIEEKLKTLFEEFKQGMVWSLNKKGSLHRKKGEKNSY